MVKDNIAIMNGHWCFGVTIRRV